MEKIESRTLEPPFAKIDFIGGEEMGFWLVTTRYGEDIAHAARIICESECRLFRVEDGRKHRCGGISEYEDGKRGGAVITGTQSTVFGDADNPPMAKCVKHVNKTL